MTKSEALYEAAKESLGKHLTLDENIPAELGCAEALSYLLQKIGVTDIPVKGFAGTAALDNFMRTNAQFRKLLAPKFGCILIYPTGTSTKNADHGHVFVQGRYGLLSNDSKSGLFLETWTNDTAKEYYEDTFGFSPFYYEVV